MKTTLKSKGYDPIVSRDFLATAAGVSAWEAECGFSGPAEASKKLGIPLRTYCRYKAEGLPERLQREVILDRMIALAPRVRRSPR